jgi:hypothetical protein
VLIRLRLRGCVICVCSVWEGEWVPRVSWRQVGGARRIQMCDAGWRVDENWQRWMPFAVLRGRPSDSGYADAKCALRVERGAGQEKGHRTPGNERSIAHAFLGVGAGRASGKMRRGFTTEVTENTEGSGRKNAGRMPALPVVVVGIAVRAWLKPRPPSGASG